ncbi:MAG TPA: hypothetical protein VF245_12890 [Solirubrobacterales bacterium]
MARICKSCGTDVARHRKQYVHLGRAVRLCPIRPLTKKERVARDLPAEPQAGEAARLIVDRDLLIPEEA